MSFLAIKPRDTQDTIYLNVVIGSLEVIPDLDINITDLNRGSDGTKYKHFFNNGFGGLSFKCKVMFKEDNSNMETLHQWIIDSVVLQISTDIIDLPKESDHPLFIITNNPSRKQDYDHYTTWDLEFTSYSDLTTWKFENDNTGIKNAITKAKKAKAKAAAKKKQKKELKALNKALMDCSVLSLVYSKKKKSTKCNKILQKALKRHQSQKITQKM